MKGRSYKQKFQAGVSFTSDGKEHSTPTLTTDFDYDQVDGIAPQHGHNRDEIEVRLKEHGLTEIQRAVAVASYCERKSTREIAAEFGKTHTWVQNTLKRVLGLPRALPPTTSKPKAVGKNRVDPLPLMPLKAAGLHALRCFTDYPHAIDIGHTAAGLAELSLPATASEQEKAIAAVSCWPWLLSHPKAGPPLAEKLADVMTKARYGSKHEAKSARATLAMLTRYKQGNRCPIPDDVLGSESLAICVTLAELQRAWRNRKHERPIESDPASLEWIREQFPDTVEGFNDKELLPRLKGGLLPSAARFAEQATGISGEAFMRAWSATEDIKALQQYSRP